MFLYISAWKRMIIIIILDYSIRGTWFFFHYVLKTLIPIAWVSVISGFKEGHPTLIETHERISLGFSLCRLKASWDTFFSLSLYFYLRHLSTYGSSLWNCSPPCLSASSGLANALERPTSYWHASNVLHRWMMFCCKMILLRPPPPPKKSRSPFSAASLVPLWSRWCTFWSPAGRRRRRSRRKLDPCPPSSCGFFRKKKREKEKQSWKPGLLRAWAPDEKLRARRTDEAFWAAASSLPPDWRWCWRWRHVEPGKPWQA